MYYLYLSLVLLLWLCGPDPGYTTSDPFDIPEAGLEGVIDKHYDKMIVDIRDITSNSAVVEWRIPDDQGLINSFMVSCRHGRLFFPLEYTLSNDVNSLVLTDLTSDTNHTCILLAEDTDGWRRLLEPIHFNTLKTHIMGPVNATSGSLVTKTGSSVALFTVSILMVILLLTLCAGGCAVVLKTRAILKRKAKHSSSQPLLSSPMNMQSIRGGQPSSFNCREDMDHYKKLCSSIRSKYQVPDQSTLLTTAHTTLLTTAHTTLLTTAHTTLPLQDNQLLPSQSSEPVMQYDDYYTPCDSSDISLSSVVHLSILSAPLLPPTSALQSVEHPHTVLDKVPPSSANSDTALVTLQ